MTDNYESFKIGTKEDAQAHNWISLTEARKMYKSDQDFLVALSGITLFTKDELKDTNRDMKATWSLFEKKVTATQILYHSKSIFMAYVKYVLRKFIRNGYQRV